MAVAEVEVNEDGRKSLNQEQVDFFWENGYLTIGKMLDDDVVELLRREYDKEFDLARSGRNEFRNLSIKDTDDVKEKVNAEGQMLQIMQMCERNIHYRNLLFHEKILDIVEDLIGPNIQLFHDQALFKPPHNAGPIHWHQDNGYWRCVPASLVSCWITLDDVDVDNGAMQILPRSHLIPVAHERSESQKDTLFDISDQLDDSNSVTVDLPAGGVNFHHCQTMHYTAPNTTDRQRRALAIHFMPPGTRSLSKGEFKVSFGNPMLRMRI